MFKYFFLKITMNHLQKLFFFLLCTLVPICAATQAQADTEALDFSSLGSGFDYYQGNSYSLGWAFTPSENITVTQLGFYDDLKNGLTESHNVGIFDAQTCALLAIATVTPADSLTGFFRYHEISPVTLDFGKMYFIATVSGSERYAVDVTTLNIDPRILFEGYAASGGNGANPIDILTCPDNFQVNTIHGDFGPSFMLLPEALVGPATRLPAPYVQVEEHEVVITLKAFSGVKKAKSRILPFSSRLKPKVGFNYLTVITKIKNSLGKKLEKQKVLQTITERNTVTLHNLPPGVYTASYRVQITSGTGTHAPVTSSTGFSPHVIFDVS